MLSLSNPVVGFMVQLEFETFDLEESKTKAANCPFDYVEINSKRYPYFTRNFFLKYYKQFQ